MSNCIIDELIGKKVYGSIGEPWDFKSNAGKNTIAGLIEAVSPNGMGPKWVLCRIRPFLYIRKKIVRVVAVSRYGNTEFLTRLCEGKRNGANLVFDPNGTPVDKKGIAQMLIKQGYPLLAGSIEVSV